MRLLSICACVETWAWTSGRGRIAQSTLSVYSHSCTWFVCRRPYATLTAPYMHAWQWRFSFDFISARDCIWTAGWRVRNVGDSASYKRPPSTSVSQRQQSLGVYVSGGVHLPAARLPGVNIKLSFWALCLLPWYLYSYLERKRLC